MKHLFLSLCLLPSFLSGQCDNRHGCYYDNHLDHKRQLIIESQLSQIREVLKDYQQIMDHEDYNSILYNLYVIDNMLH